MSPHANGVIAREHTSSIHMPSPASSPSTHGSAPFTAAVQLAAARTCGVPRYTARGCARGRQACLVCYGAAAAAAAALYGYVSAHPNPNPNPNS
eukprot:scaffold20521_cov59-Phaeocystis_antarctica.AAC.4